MRFRLPTLTGLLILCLGAMPLARSAQVVSLGQVYGCCNGFGISGDGQTVVGSFAPIQTSVPQYWTTTQGVVTVPGRRGAFNSISRDGSTLAGTGLATDNFKYSAASGFIDLPATSGRTDIIGLGPSALTDDGSTVVGKQPQDGFSTGESAVAWDAAGNPSVLSQGAALDVSGDGSVVVGRSRINGINQAVVWTAGTVPGTRVRAVLDSTGLGAEEARAVSSDGRIVFGQVAGGTSFRWEQGLGIQDIGGSVANSQVWDTTADGFFAVGSINDPLLTGNASKAAIWDAANGWRTLEDLLLAAGFAGDALARLEVASAVSTDGRYLVAGQLAAWNNPGEAFWIDLGAPLSVAAVPLPAAVWLFASGAAGLFGMAWKKNLA
ncbi:MAG TPA: hypothetical protein ENK05_07415 [Gammaproteobacteria bacterium]|nr:hypothetical protein [Gammaproteobacteria bacterium]